MEGAHAPSCSSRSSCGQIYNGPGTATLLPRTDESRPDESLHQRTFGRFR